MFFPLQAQMVLIMKSQLKLLSPVFQKLVLRANLPSVYLSLFLLSLNADKVDKSGKAGTKENCRTSWGRDTADSDRVTCRVQYLTPAPTFSGKRCTQVHKSILMQIKTHVTLNYKCSVCGDRMYTKTAVNHRLSCQSKACKWIHLCTEWIFQELWNCCGTDINTWPLAPSYLCLLPRLRANNRRGTDTSHAPVELLGDEQ